jgi:hypothetical protein
MMNCFAPCQSRSTGAVAARDASSANLLAQAFAPSRVVRAMDDRNTNLRWLLVKDEQHPSGPGRLVPMQGSSQGSAAAASEAAGSQRMGFAPVRLLIREGDRVVVEEHARAFDARLEAVALESAFAGSRVKVRLKLGGKTVDAVAKGPGLVEMDRGAGGHR